LLLAREFARRGCRVALCARSQTELDRAREQLEQQGAEAMAVRCDVGDRRQVEVMVEEVTAHFGRVDILVNNAGIMRVGPIQNQTVEDFEQSMDVMFWGVLYPILAVLPQMLERHAGRIVNITSIGGKVSVPHVLPYSSAKFAAVGLSEGLRAELTGKGISVVTIVPGLTRTGSHLNAVFKGHHESEYRWFALGASLPIVSMDAERAARRIVEAAARGETEVILSFPANLLARLHGLFPGATVNALELANRLFLPEPAQHGSVTSGAEAQERLASPLLEFLTAWGLSAARRYQQQPSTPTPPGPGG
jgi:short-subunit dehydrogenase